MIRKSMLHASNRNPDLTMGKRVPKVIIFFKDLSLLPETRAPKRLFYKFTFLEIPIRFLGLKKFSERIQSLQVVGIPIGIPRNSGY